MSAVAREEVSRRKHSLASHSYKCYSRTCDYHVSVRLHTNIRVKAGQGLDARVVSKHSKSDTSGVMICVARVVNGGIGCAKCTMSMLSLSKRDTVRLWDLCLWKSSQLDWTEPE